MKDYNLLWYNLLKGYYLLGGVFLNTAKDRIKKLIDELPETKVGEVIDFLLYLKTKSEQELYLTPEEEEIYFENIKNEEKISFDDAKRLLIGEDDE